MKNSQKKTQKNLTKMKIIQKIHNNIKKNPKVFKYSQEIRKSGKTSKNLKDPLLFHKIWNFRKYFLVCHKKMLSYWFPNIRRMRFDQRSPVQPVPDFRVGSKNLTEDGRTDKGNPCAHVFAGPLNPGEPLFVKYLRKWWRWEIKSTTFDMFCRF